MGNKPKQVSETLEDPAILDTYTEDAIMFSVQQELDHNLRDNMQEVPKE